MLKLNRPSGGRGGRPTSGRRPVIDLSALPVTPAKPADFMRRTRAVLAVIIILGLGCMGRLGFVQLFSDSDKEMAQQLSSYRYAQAVLQAQRGTITDVNGTVLAQSVERYTIYADQSAAAGFQPIHCTGKNDSVCHSIDGKDVGVDGPAGVARLLAPVLGMDAKELGAQLTGTSGYVVLKKDVVPEVKRAVDALHVSNIIGTELTMNRDYPSGDLMGALIGGVGDDGSGVAGVELMADGTLSGTDGSVSYEQGMYGQKIPGTETQRTDPVDGGSVKLTIDRDVQWYAEKTLKEWQGKNHADWGIAIVQEIGTGNLLAVADTDGITAGSSEAKLNSPRAFATSFDPGSTGKVLTMSALLQEGLRKPTDQFTVPSSMTVDNEQFKDASDHDTTNWTLAGILQQSSNIGTIMASSDLSDQKRYEYLTKFGIGRTGGSGFPGESSGLLTDYKQWDRRTRNTVLFGQGYTATALQMTNAIATVANKGKRLPQRLIDSTTDNQGHETKASEGKATQVVDEGTAATMMNMMEDVSDNYKNFLKALDGYRVAGKSGTAQVADSSGQLNNIIGSWIGVLPADNPKFAVYVAFQNSDDGYGGITSTPAMAQIGVFLMQKYDVPQSAKRTDAIPTTW